jgi:hypothetical protein
VSDPFSVRCFEHFLIRKEMKIVFVSFQSSFCFFREP